MANDRVYIHEFIDVIGQNRARYMHYITAHWSPIAERERDQLCFGVWGTLGSTGRWPEVVNLWEHKSWENLARSFDMERSAPTLQDPSLEEWWAGAAELRRGGVDRILVAANWTRSIAQLVADGVRGDFYAHELVTVPSGDAFDFLDLVEQTGREAVARTGAECVGAWRVAMADDSECLLLWSFPDCLAWARYEQAWTPDGLLADWRATVIGAGARIDRIVLLDSPLSPLRTGRQPSLDDRRPLSDI